MFSCHPVEAIEEFQPLYAHSVVSQALYQDPLLWMLNVAYRVLYGNREYRMIAYPTHALRVQNYSTFGIHASLAALQHNKGGAIIRSWIALQKEELSVNEAGQDAGPWVVASHFPRRFRKWMEAVLAKGGQVSMKKFFTRGTSKTALDSSALLRISNDDDIRDKCVIDSSLPMGSCGISMHRACVPAGFDATNDAEGYWAGHTLLRIVSDDAMTTEERPPRQGPRSGPRVPFRPSSSRKWIAGGRFGAALQTPIRDSGAQPWGSIRRLSGPSKLDRLRGTP